MNQYKFSNYKIKVYDNEVSCFYNDKKVGVISYNIKDDNVLINTSINNDKLIYEKMFIRHLFLTMNFDTLYINNVKVTNKEFFFLNNYTYLLFDVDDTLLSFKKAEKMALTYALRKVGLIASESIINHYHDINIKYWEKVEKKEITREECLIKRFEEFLPLYNINYNPADFEDLYRSYLDKYAYLIKDAKYVLNSLKDNFKIYAVTNGVRLTQIRRVKKAKLNTYFIKSFISEEIGHNKPSTLFYKAILDNVDNFDRSKAIIIGDSLTSDVKLGINNNTDTIWFNLYYKENNSDIKSNYTINKLIELLIHYKN